ncbi:MAG: hypothetical protein WBK55_00025 [Alphaproteobacteria bacterium]
MNEPDQHPSIDTMDNLAQELPCDTNVDVREKLGNCDQTLDEVEEKEKRLYKAYDEALNEVYKRLESLPTGLEAMVDYTIFYCGYTVLYCGADELSKLEVLRAKQGLVFDTSKSFIPSQAMDKSRADFILETALSRSDFRAIRAILYYEGYGIPVKEPNDLVLPAEWDNEDSDDSARMEIQITPEEYEIWKSQPDIPEPSPTVEKSATQKALAESIAKTIPLHLERLIRRRDVVTLRTMLRLYGHNISSGEPPSKVNLNVDVPEPTNS